MDKARPTFKLSAASLSQEKLGTSASKANPRFLLSSGQLFAQSQPKPEPSTSTSASVPKSEQPNSPDLTRPQKTPASHSRSVAAAASKPKRPTSAQSSSSSTSSEAPPSEPRPDSAATSKSNRPSQSQSRSAAASQMASASTSRSIPQSATSTQSRSRRIADSDSEDSDDYPIGNVGIGDRANHESGINNNDDEDSGSDATSIDSETFKESYQNLTMDAKKIRKQLQYEKLQKSKEIMENVLEGQGLAVHMGCSSTKAITAWDHTAAIAETVAAQARQCGTVCNIFSADKYMDLLMASCKDRFGRYESELLSQKMYQHYVGCSRLGTSGMTTLLGLVDFSVEDASDELPAAHKPRKRAQFSQKLTQHEVINSQIKPKDKKEKNQMWASIRKAKAIRSACKQRGQSSVPLVAFAMSGAENPGDFLQNVFEVAVATRDGYASLENSVDPGGFRPEDNHQLDIQGTDPPATYTDGSLDVRRYQHIVSFNAKQMREMLCKKKIEPK